MRTRIRKRSTNLLKQVTRMRETPPEEMSWLERQYWRWFLSRIGLRKDCIDHIPEYMPFLDIFEPIGIWSDYQFVKLLNCFFAIDQVI